MVLTFCNLHAGVVFLPIQKTRQVILMQVPLCVCMYSVQLIEKVKMISFVVYLYSEDCLVYSLKFNA